MGETLELAQSVLDGYATIDKANELNFLTDIGDGYATHRPLLLLSLLCTQFEKNPVIEMGSGNGSTPFLEKYCGWSGRKFYSFESDFEWAQKMCSRFVEDWDACTYWQEECSVLFIDHAPGEHRVKALRESKDRAKVIVVHDTELYSAGDYGFDNKKGPGSVWDEFRYVLHYNRKGGGAGATAVSQTINLNRFKFLSLSKFTFE